MTSFYNFFPWNKLHIFLPLQEALYISINDDLNIGSNKKSDANSITKNADQCAIKKGAKDVVISRSKTTFSMGSCKRLLMMILHGNVCQLKFLLITALK